MEKETEAYPFAIEVSPTKWRAGTEEIFRFCWLCAMKAGESRDKAPFRSWKEPERAKIMEEGVRGKDFRYV